jgi:hypothetical protein
MPAFGAFTGGLNVRDAVFADLFGTLAFIAHLLGDGRLYTSYFILSLSGAACRTSRV